MKKILLFGLLLLTVIPVTGQQTLSPELLWKIQRVSDPQVSPDGKSVLFGVSAYDLGKNKGNRDLYIIDLPSTDGKGKAAVKTGRPRRITNTPEGEYNARWQPDGQKIVFLRSTPNGTQLYEMNPDGSDDKIIYRVDGGIGNFGFFPGGNKIYFTRDVKMDATVNEMYKDLPKANARIIDNLMYRHWNQWHDFAYSHVFVASYEGGKVGVPQDIMKGESFDSPLQPFGGDEQIAGSPSGRYLAYTCKKLSGKDYAVSTNSEIYLYDTESGQTSNLTAGNSGYDIDPIFSPDGQQIAWLSMARDGYESDKNRIMVADVSGGKPRDITEKFAHNASGIFWSADGKEIFFISAINATKQVFSVNVAKGKVRQITEGAHNMNSAAEAGDWLVASRNTMSYPAELYVVNKATGKYSPLTAMNGSILSMVKWGTVRQRMVKTSDGKDMHAWVIYPPDFDPKKKYPTLLYCQGGPQSTVSQFFSYRWNFQLMAAKGYIVVAPNRRGLPSFGQEWNEEISGDWGGQAIRDYLAAIDDVSQEEYVDRDKLGAVGASYGGYSVYYLAGVHEKRFKTFISHCGLYNLESWYGSTEEMFFANWDIGGAYWDNPQPKSYAKFSPHKLAGKWDTPMLVIHGGKDFRVPETQGMEAFNAAQLQGIPSRFLYFPTEGHWVQSPQNGVLWHRVFFEWLDEYLKD